MLVTNSRATLPTEHRLCQIRQQAIRQLLALGIHGAPDEPPTADPNAPNQPPAKVKASTATPREEAAPVSSHEHE
ncbi:MAG: hypothetical protein KAJ19_11365 [Gammaproteobacteria bacterium]|nr:hypothetical protein [Gammaproteobacteria bacterium]